MFLFAEDGEHHAPLIVEFINHYLGEPVYQIQMRTTHAGTFGYELSKIAVFGCKIIDTQAARGPATKVIVNILDREVIRTRASLKFGHRGDVFEL